MAPGSPREVRPWEADLVRALGEVAQAFARLQEAAACLDRQAPSPPEIAPELWVTQLGEYDLVCVREDLERAARAADEGLQVAKRWAATRR